MQTKLACVENVFLNLQAQLQPPSTLRVVRHSLPFTSSSLCMPDYLERKLNSHCGGSEIINALSGVGKHGDRPEIPVVLDLGDRV